RAAHRQRQPCTHGIGAAAKAVEDGDFPVLANMIGRCHRCELLGQRGLELNPRTPVSWACPLTWRVRAITFSRCTFPRHISAFAITPAISPRALSPGFGRRCRLSPGLSPTTHTKMRSHAPSL